MLNAFHWKTEEKLPLVTWLRHTSNIKYKWVAISKNESSNLVELSSGWFDFASLSLHPSRYLNQTHCKVDKLDFISKSILLFGCILWSPCMDDLISKMQGMAMQIALRDHTMQDPCLKPQ